MKRLSFLLLSIAIIISATFPALSETPGATTATSAFISAPTKVFPLLDSLTRLDMIDYFTAGQTTPSNNRVGSQSRLTAITPDSLTIALTKDVTHSIYILPTKGGDTLFAVVRTVALPALDSKIEFYDSDWKALPTGSLIELPAMNDWLSAKDKATRRQVTADVPFIPAYITLDTSGMMLSVVNTLDNLLPRETREQVAGKIHPRLNYKWNGSKFKLVK